MDTSLAKLCDESTSSVIRGQQFCWLNDRSYIFRHTFVRAECLARIIFVA